MFEEEEEGEAAAGSSEEADDLRADEPWAAPAASSTATPTASDIYDVYVSYSRADLAWAERLVRELSDRGLRCFFDLDMSAGDSWTETLNRALDNSRTLVVLWSAAAADAKGIRSELADFEVLMRRQDQPRRMLPIMLGGADLLRSAPNALRSRQALIIGPEAYAAGPEADSEEWTQAVEAISNAARASPRFDPTRRRTKQAPQPAASRPGSFSASARAALTYAAAMLGDLGDDEPARVRTAALLGALYAAAMSGMTPTTGDVLRLVLSRQPHGRTADETLAAAGIAAGLKRLPEARAAVMTLDELTRSPVAALVREAAEMQVRTASARVHLRHVLATGVHPSVSPQALAELRITMAELRAEWRASIARTWPAESAEGWDSILLERRAGATFGQAPPSASVHRDRWTIDDGLDYALYAKAISEFIGHKDAKPPLVISVQAPWGQGKTSLMRMVQSNLDPDHPDLRDLGSNKRKTDLVEPPSQLTFRDLRDSLDGDVTIDHSEQEEIRTVWFNAWKYQSSEQIWAGLAHAILSQLPARLSARNREFFWLRLQLRRIDPSVVRGDIHRAALERFLPRLAGWAVLALGAIIVAGLSLLAGGLGAAGTGLAGAGALGIAAVARRAWAKATTDVLERRLEGAYLRYVRQPDYASKLGYLHLVEEDMGRALDLLTPDDKPTVIFIDDLDRCSPAKIGEVVEAVNLFLAGDYPNCAFVIGIDAEVVAASMEVVHAEIIEKLADRRGELGWRFMDKFVQLPLDRKSVV